MSRVIAFSSVFGGGGDLWRRLGIGSWAMVDIGISLPFPHRESLVEVHVRALGVQCLPRNSDGSASRVQGVSKKFPAAPRNARTT